MSPVAESLSIFFAALAAYLSGVFRGDNLPRQWNILIALAAFLVCTGMDVWLLVGFTSDVRADVGILLVTGVGLAGREFVGLMNYIEGAPSPLTSLVRPTILQRRNTPPYTVGRPPDKQVL